MPFPPMTIKFSTQIVFERSLQFITNANTNQSSFNCKSIEYCLMLLCSSAVVDALRMVLLLFPVYIVRVKLLEWHPQCPLIYINYSESLVHRQDEHKTISWRRNLCDVITANDLSRRSEGGNK